MASAPGSTSKAAPVIEVVDDSEDDDDGDEDSVDDEQLEEYREMVENLGNFPDKVQINSLTMVAEDYSETKKGAKAIYNLIRERLLSSTVSREKLLPLVYLVDSIIKNAKGHFVKVIQADAIHWMPTVYKKLDAAQSSKMQRVWKTWKDGRILSEASLNAIEQQCFGSSSSSSSPMGGNTSSGASVAGILRAKDGTLILPKALRQEMQNLLDDMQTETMEMEKMSLERLADKEPELFASVKQTAQESLNSSATLGGGQNHGGGGGGGGGHRGTGGGSSGLSGSYNNNNSNQLPSFIIETRSPTIIKHANAWRQIFSQQTATTGTTTNSSADSGGANMDTALDKAIQPLKKRILDDTTEGRYTQDEAMEMTQYLAAVSATASLLEALQQQEQAPINSSGNSTYTTKLSKYLNASSFLFSVSHGNNDAGGGGNLANNRRRGGTGSIPSSVIVVDVKDFTNDGIKRKAPAVIAILYDVGLPFVSAADGRRFRTQLELSNHLDALFKRSQLEKSMTRTQERDWYIDSVVWMGETTSQQGLDNAALMASGASDNPAGMGGTAMDDGYDPATSTMPADESRDRCVICGLNFKMEFDNDDGIYKYQNCREIGVLNDADDSEELRLVHVTCWRGLGSPVVLTMDQALQEALH